ncbi:hypothetical protein EBB07_30900 [Paenibacillaceae bacterium]|nr:hypothetical protein EBB07_30900 [Paenibacillaceae bacterium]
MNTTAMTFVEGEIYPAILNDAYTAFTVEAIDAGISKAYIIWADGNTEEWAYLSDIKRWIDVE